MNKDHDNPKQILFIDHDGAAIVPERRGKTIAPSNLTQAIITAAEKFGPVMQVRSYACWNQRRYGTAAAILKEAGVEPIIIAGQDKNQADREIIQDICANIPHFDRCGLFTNDDDLLPAVEAVHKAGKQVALIFWREAVNQRLLAAIPSDLRVPLEEVLVSEFDNTPSSARTFNAEDLRTVLVTAELLLRRRSMRWLPYQMLIETMMPMYTYHTAEQLIRAGIDNAIFIADHYQQNGIRHIIFINYESKDVINTIAFLNLLLRLVSDCLQRQPIGNVVELARGIASQAVVRQLGEDPYFWITLLQQRGVLQQRMKRVPGSLTLDYELKLVNSHIDVPHTQEAVPMAA